MDDWLSVVCPSCFEAFQVPGVTPAEVPGQLDYDCEVCCRPMVLHFSEDGQGEVIVEALSLDD